MGLLLTIRTHPSSKFSMVSLRIDGLEQFANGLKAVVQGDGLSQVSVCQIVPTAV